MYARAHNQRHYTQAVRLACFVCGAELSLFFSQTTRESRTKKTTKDARTMQWAHTHIGMKREINLGDRRLNSIFSRIRSCWWDAVLRRWEIEAVSSLLFETHYPIFLYDRLREPGGVSKLDTSVESRVESGSSQLMLQKNTGRIGRISECMTLWKQNNIEAKSCCGIWNLGKLLRRVRRRSSCWNFKSTRLLKVQAHPKWVEIN